MSDAHPKVYLLDVEGTVAPLTLTTDLLFPYARAHFEEFLRMELAQLGPEKFPQGQSASDGLMWDLATLSAENLSDLQEGAPRVLPAGSDVYALAADPYMAVPRVAGYALWLMDRDRKSTALKSLQGKIWKSGFEAGQLKAQLFEDVPEALARWSAHAKVAIYSSGSVEAQRLVFRYSQFGDLTGFIAGYYDTRVGVKAAADSYRAIAASMEVATRDVLFFSDAIKEVDAAREAGCSTRLAVRPGNPAVPDPRGHAAVESFAAE